MLDNIPKHRSSRNVARNSGCTLREVSRFLYRCGRWSYDRGRGSGVLVASVVEGHRRIGGCETFEHQVNGTDLDHRFGGGGGAFVVLTVAARATVPGIGPLHDPAFANHVEAGGARRRKLDDN